MMTTTEKAEEAVAMQDEIMGLEINDISKSFGQTEVLKKLSFHIPKGKLFSILGPSGCGKSTTLNLIAGFLTPDTGSISVQGRDITKLPPNKRDIAVVFQNYALFPHMKVRDNIAYGLKIRKTGRAAIDVKVAEVAEALELGQVIDRYPSQLSGGQQQRVSLARALAVEPSLLLMDEPLSNLDVRLRKEVRLQIRNLQQELGQTAVFVTHDQEEALAISDLIAVLNNGWLEQIGTPREIWQQPKTDYVAKFVGISNVLPVEVKDGEAVLALRGANQGSVLGAAARKPRYVGFRPKSTIVARDTGEHGSFGLYGTVLAYTYTGDGVEYQIDCDTNEPILAWQPNEEGLLGKGERVHVAIKQEELLLLDESQDVAGM